MDGSKEHRVISSVVQESNVYRTARKRSAAAPSWLLLAHAQASSLLLRLPAPPAS